MKMIRVLLAKLYIFGQSRRLPARLDRERAQQICGIGSLHPPERFGLTFSLLPQGFRGEQRGQQRHCRTFWSRVSATVKGFQPVSPKYYAPIVASAMLDP